MNRRKFIRNTATFVTLAGMSYPLRAFDMDKVKTHVTILHTNDTHSHIDPFPSTHSRYANMGGVSRRASLIEQVRKENPNTLLLDAGDIFQGTPYFNFFGGEIEFKLMSKLGYDAATIGNHDFDNGIEGLAKQLPHAKFDFVTSNYDFSNTVLDGRTRPYKVFQAGKVKVGVFGLGIELEGLVLRRLYRETQYLDPKEVAQSMVKTLREDEKCDLVICLSHLGYEYTKNPSKPSDMKIAEQVDGIDLIIGGHTHTFLEKPTIVQNKYGNEVLVNQVGWAGLRLGRIDFYLDAANKVKGEGAAILV